MNHIDMDEWRGKTYAEMRTELGVSDISELTDGQVEDWVSGGYAGSSNRSFLDFAKENDIPKATTIQWLRQAIESDRTVSWGLVVKEGVFDTGAEFEEYCAKVDKDPYMLHLGLPRFMGKDYWLD